MCIRDRQVLEQFFLQKAAAGGKFLPESPQIGLLALVLLDAGGDALQHLEQFLAAHRLEQLFLDAQGNGLPGVGEIVVARQDDHIHPGHGAHGRAAQLQPVHKGHSDVGNQDIRLDRCVYETVLTWALLAANYGQPRAYALAAAALGFAAQRLTLAPLVSGILRLLGRVSGWVVVAISRPVWVKNIFR